MMQLLLNKKILFDQSGTKRFLSLLVIFFLGFTSGLKAQISFSAESMALGGGGTAYLTGYESLFVNPANLYISEKNYSYQLSLLQGAYYYDSLLPVDNNFDRFRDFYNRSSFFNAGDTRTVLDEASREQIIERSFGNHRSSSVFTNRADIYWIGMKWVRPKRSYAFSLRSRFASQYELGRGYYSGTPLERNNSFHFEQSFHYRYEALHELSFGFAESFTYLNGLIPGLSEFIVGVAPKVVVPGSYMNADFTNSYNFVSDGAFWQRNLQYTQQTTGILSDHAAQFFSSQPSDLPSGNKSFRDLMQPTGIGVGLDIGITYLITFGEDLSVLRRQDDPTDQSLRISFSITDLGAVYYYNKPFEYQTEPKTISTNTTGSLLQTEFGGAPNEHYNLVEEYGDLLAFSTDSFSEDNFNTLLPTTINAGGLFQYRRMKMMGDLSYSVSESAFTPKGLTTYLGLEIRPIRKIPLRAGTRLGSSLSGLYSLGAGFETERFDLNAAIQVKSRNSNPTSEILAASLLGIKFYIQ